VPDPQTVVIAGGGLAGASAAAALREEGFDGRVVVVAAEPQLPYERPPLSKSYLAGDSTLADARAQPDAFYAEHDVEVRTATEAVGLDVAARRLELTGGEALGYDRLLLATGAVPRRPPIEGADGERVHLLRSVADADALRAAIGDGGRLAVIGAGWIGCEVAATARGLGAEVTLIEQAAAPLERVLGRRLGDFFAALHRGHGVDLRTGTGVAAIEDGGRGVRLHDGEVVACDAVLLAVGVAPATALAEAAGLDVDDGVVASELLETSAPGVFAAGDVASALHPIYGRHVRVEHWDNAKAQGAAAGRAMLGAGEPYAKLPYFFTDQYDLGMEYVGLHGPEDDLVLRGSLEEARFQAFWTAADGTVTAGMHVNDWDAIGPIREIVGRRGALDAA
jgi:3-phenylpropionate/trans-cinnamate dioxygenase ferredoxin reductase subunit